MLESAIYINYAKALFKSAQSLKQAISLSQELRDIENFISSHPELYSYFTPIYSKNTQCKIINNLSRLANLSKLMKGFIEMITINGRINQISAIYHQYQKLIDDKQNIKKSIIYSANKLSTLDKKTIETFLHKHFDYQFEFENILSPDLIKGIQIVVDSKVIDISARGALGFYHNILRGTC